MGTYLDRILASHRASADADRRPIGDLIAAAAACPEPGRPFAAALTADDDVAVIAEVKRRSPSRGDLAPQLDPATLAVAYTGAGAAALSVLTDREFFAGSPDDLRRARDATGIPVLRKDFTVSPADVCDARLMGADAVLLIAAALPAGALADLLVLSGEVGITALVEVHDEDEAERAVDVGAALIGVNQRDLVTFEVDTARAERVAKVIPAGVTRVAESGIRGHDAVARLGDAGYDAVLVGEALVSAPDPGAALLRLRGWA